MTKACGNAKCKVSTGIHEGLTFGSGELDSNGYWSKPCYPCARASDARMPQTIAKIARDLIREGLSKRQVRKYIARSEWLWLKGWPLTVA